MTRIGTAGPGAPGEFVSHGARLGTPPSDRQHLARTQEVTPPLWCMAGERDEDTGDHRRTDVPELHLEPIEPCCCLCAGHSSDTLTLLDMGIVTVVTFHGRQQSPPHIEDVVLCEICVELLVSHFMNTPRLI